MLPKELTDPKSILVVGGSENPDQLGGSVLKNLLDQQYKGQLFVLNPKRDRVQGIVSFKDVEEAPYADLAIFAIPAANIYPILKVLSLQKKIRAYIIYSAGFSELNEEGRKLEQKILNLINKTGSCLLGPNNIGLLNRNFAGIFTKPIPKLDAGGVDFVSASGATAVFTLEAAQQTGLSFNSVITVGNGAQIGIEEVLQHWDETFAKQTSSRVKLLYIEGLREPEKFLHHCISLRNKGCHLVALKAGSTEKGIEAAASHTGAMASPDLFVQALFEKAGVIRCHSRYALITIAGLLQLSASAISKLAVITHAGGPGVILTDHLVNNGLDVPTFSEHHLRMIKNMLFPGASASNPIDLLATGTAEQLETVIEYCDEEIDEIDGIIVIFGSPGLGSVKAAYEVIHKRTNLDRKPIFPVLPSVVNLKEDIQEFLNKGHIAFFDESLVGHGLGKISKINRPEVYTEQIEPTESTRIRKVLQRSGSGYLEPSECLEILRHIGIQTVDQFVVSKKTDLNKLVKKIEFPLVMKVIGIIHKTDQNGVILNLNSLKELQSSYRRLMALKGATGVLIQPMVSGLEVFIGAKRVIGFPPLILFGFGGIYVEIMKEFKQVLAPLSTSQAFKLLSELKGHEILQGVRGKKGIDLEQFAKSISAISLLMTEFPEIVELDINPLKANSSQVIAVDARIRIEEI